jgi:hypothetical protein
MHYAAAFALLLLYWVVCYNSYADRMIKKEEPKPSAVEILNGDTVKVNTIKVKKEDAENFGY